MNTIRWSYLSSVVQRNWLMDHRLHFKLCYNKLDACQQNNENFIIHVSTCNPLVFIWREKYNQISGSTVPLNCIPAVSLPSVRKNLLLNPAQHPDPTPTPASPPFFFLTLQNDPLSLSSGHIQRKNKYLT